jgi:hypothetical protein
MNDSNDDDVSFSCCYFTGNISTQTQILKMVCYMRGTIVIVIIILFFVERKWNFEISRVCKKKVKEVNGEGTSTHK